MMKKMIMITIYLVIGFQAKAAYEPSEILRTLASSAKAEAKKMQNICEIHAGDVGKLRYKADTYEKAFSKVTDECFQKRNELYVRNRNEQPDQDRQIEFAESCLNSVKCI